MEGPALAGVESERVESKRATEDNRESIGGYDGIREARTSSFYGEFQFSLKYHTVSSVPMPTEITKTRKVTRQAQLKWFLRCA
jgi:hypothetical protein